MNPKISIIVPVYNVEKYLNRCLDSILAQSFTDWECILVDDGSPDNSGRICDEYAVKDSRFRVFHKENGGVSSARNLGLEKTTGEWVVFVDSDDTLWQNALETMMLKSSGNDMSIFNLQFKYESGKERHQEILERQVSSMQVINELLCYKTNGGPVAKLFNASIAKSLKFKEELTIGEDLFYNIEFLLKSKKDVNVYNDIVYDYCINTESVMQQEDNRTKYYKMNQIVDFVFESKDAFDKSINYFKIVNILQPNFAAGLLPSKKERTEILSLYRMGIPDDGNSEILRYINNINRFSGFIANILLKFKYSYISIGRMIKNL